MEKQVNELIQKINWEAIRTPNFINIDGEHKEIGTESLLRNDTHERLHKTAITDSFQFTTIKEMENIVNNFSVISEYPIVGWDEFANGNKVIAYLKSDKESICGYDFDEYLTIVNGFDGTTSFSIGTSSILIRCANQWGRILLKAKVKNTKNHVSKRDDFMKDFQQYILNKNRLYETIEMFPKIAVDKKLAREMVEDLILNPEVKDFEEASTRSQNKILDVMASVDREMAEVGNNGFGFFNGITYYTTHIQNQKHNSFGNIIPGTKNALNQKVFNKLANMAMS